MKTTIFKLTFAAALAIIAGVTATRAQDKENMLSDVNLANVEALIEGEHGSGTCYRSITEQSGSYILYCGTCTYIRGTNAWFSGTGTCN